MRIGSVHIRNFRKLKNCHIEFAEKETVFVGANNSGKTSAISAIVWFIKNTEKFTLKEFSATNWAKINEIGEKWLKNPSEFDEKLLSGHLWDELVPSLDLWIELEDGEQYRVSHLIPSLTTWQGKTVGVRSQYQPKDTRKLLSAYEEAKEKAKKLESSEEWEKASRPKLFPQDLCDFLRKGSNLKDFFEVKYFVIDAEKEIDDDPGAQATPDDALDSNPFTELIRVDAILASRDFSDPEGQTDNDIDTLSKQFQQYYKASRKADEDLTVNDLELLAGVFNANRTYDQQITKAFEAPVEELRNINYPGFQNPSITLSSKIQIEEVMKHESAVQFSIHGQKDLVLPEKYNGLGYRNLISIYLKLLEFRERWSAQKNDDEAIEPIHLVFIEEPEAHLHAQAQQVFVKKAFEVYFKTLNYILSLNKKGIVFSEAFTTMLLKKILTPWTVGFVDLQSPTGNGFSVTVYNYDGDVYASDESRMLNEMGDAQFRLGNVFSDSYKDIYFGSAMQLLGSVGVAECLAGCSECPFVPYCGSDPVRHYATQRDAYGNRATSDFCKKYSLIFEHLFELLSQCDQETEQILWSWIRETSLEEIRLEENQ